VRRAALPALAAAALFLGACAQITGTAQPPMGGLETRYRLVTRRAARVSPAPPAAATRVYRDFLARSMFSRCRMIPTDSQLFDLRARRCGSVPAAVLGWSRMLLEVEATPATVRPALLDGHLGWFDLPGVERECAP
jgi:hypothetical protein